VELVIGQRFRSDSQRVSELETSERKIRNSKRDLGKTRVCDYKGRGTSPDERPARNPLRDDDARKWCGQAGIRQRDCRFSVLRACAIDSSLLCCDLSSRRLAARHGSIVARFNRIEVCFSHSFSVNSIRARSKSLAA
jgi:hypothetical protein